MPKLSELVTQPPARMKLSQVAAQPPREERIAAQRAEDMEKYSPTRGMSTGQRVAAGFGKAYADTYRGAKQLNAETMRDQVGVASAALRGVGLAGLADFIDQNVGGKLAKRANRIQGDVNEARQNDAALMDTAGGITGNVLGNVSQVLLPAGALRGTVAARALLPTTVAGNAAQGAVQGGLQPVADGESRAANVALGAAFGGGGAAAAKGAGAAYRGARTLLAPVLSSSERNAARVLMREARDPANLLAGQSSAIPGVRRTLGEETMDSGILGIEQAVRGPQRATFEPLDLANNAARVDALSTIAGTPAQRAAAESARDSATSTLRDQSFREGDEAINQAAKHGFSFQSNLGDLRARVDSIADSYAGRPSVQSALVDVSRAIDSTSADVKGLYQVRQYIGDLLSGKAGADKGYAKAASSELLQMRDMIDQEISQVSPTFGRYLKSFQQMSKPINRMDVGEELLSTKAGSAVPDLAGNRQLTPAQFSKMAQDLDTVAARATGFDKAKAAEILTPDDLKTITDVHDDLIRQYQRMKSPAGNSATSERNAVLGRIGNSIASKVPIVGSWLDAFQRNADQAVQEKLAYLIANPDEARRVIQHVSPKERAALTRVLVEMGSRTPGTLGSSVNATRANDQPLEIDIAGGTRGPAPTSAELNMLRGY